MKTPHRDKLKALFNNPKLPSEDRTKETLVFSKYDDSRISSKSTDIGM